MWTQFPVVGDGITGCYILYRDEIVSRAEAARPLETAVVSALGTAVPMPLAETVSPAVFQEEFAPVVILLAEEGAFRVGMVGLVEAGSDLPVELLHSECVLPGCGFRDVGVLVPEMSPVVSAGSAAVLMSLPAVTEVFSSAIFSGGGSLLMQPPWPM